MTRVLHKANGQPLLALAAVLLVWVGLRSAYWESPFPAVTDFLEDIPLMTKNGTAGSVVQPPSDSASYMSKSRAAADHAGSPAIPIRTYLPNTMRQSIAVGGDEPGASSSHQRMWMAAMAHVGSGWEGQQVNAMAMPSSMTAAVAPAFHYQRASRWSFDTWLFLRHNAGEYRGAGPMPAIYGGSQAGAVMRYRLSADPSNRPTAYVRVTKALVEPSQGDISAGVSVRPFAGIPVAAMAEGRLSRTGVSTELRPAALLVSELPDLKLPLKLRGQAYAQAGYVGGDFATGFADGQMKIDRELAAFDLGTVHAGAGAWGGAQKGSERIDIGPTASLTMKLGDAPVRIAMDYRHRIAGDAVPESGLALTISTGF